jgi:hypothetical protein
MIHLPPEFVLAEGMRYCSVTVAVPTDRDDVQQELEKINREGRSLAEGRPLFAVVIRP